MAEGSSAKVSSPPRPPPSPRLRRTRRRARRTKNMKHYNMGVNTRFSVTREYSNGRGVRIDGTRPSRAKDGAPYNLGLARTRSSSHLQKLERQLEHYVNSSRYIHRLSVLQSRLETNLLDRTHSCFVQSVPQALYDANDAHLAGCRKNDLYRYFAFNGQPARLFGVNRARFVQNDQWLHTDRTCVVRLRF